MIAVLHDFFCAQISARVLILRMQMRILEAASAASPAKSARAITGSQQRRSVVVFGRVSSDCT